MQNNFLEIQFPVDVSYGMTGGPEFFTDVITTNNGFEQRNSNWNNCRYRYNLAQTLKNKIQLDQLVAFFKVCKGKALGFRFKDWLDYQIKRQVLIVVDGKQSNFQIFKKYNVAGHTAYRRIFKPVRDSIVIYLNGKKIKVAIDYKNGLLNFDQPPPLDTVIEIEGEFDVPVRFDSDHLIASIENFQTFSHLEISLIELKL